MFNEEIVSGFINPFIKAKLNKYPQYQKAKYSGIAMLVSRETEDGEDHIPALLDSKGEAFYVGSDDINNLVVYHRMINTTILSLDENEKNSYGDQVIMGTRTNMKMIVWGMTDATGRTQERALGDVVASLPDIADFSFMSKYKGLKKVIFSASFANNDSDKVWAEEGGKNEKPKTTMLLFSINYTIDTELDKSCYNLCYC